MAQTVIGSFLDGDILTPRSIVNQWPSAVAYGAANSTSDLNAQFVDELTTLNALLNATPNPSLDASLVLVPISLVDDMKVSFETFQYQQGGLPADNLLQDAISLIESVYDNYSSQYYITAVPLNGFYIY